MVFSKFCCLLSLALLAAMAVFLYLPNNSNFVDNLSEVDRNNWVKYNNARKKQGMHALIIGVFITLFISLVINNKSLPVP